MAIKAIETVYKDFLFRSRLEARWAVFFDALNIKWEYEFEGFDLGDGIWYLPDFWLPQVRMWAEVKPTLLSKEERIKATRLAEGSGCPVLLLIGAPNNQYYYAIEPDGCTIDYALSAYKLEEDRFYAMPGMAFDSSNAWYDTREAVIAARQARFEHQG